MELLIPKPSLKRYNVAHLNTPSKEAWEELKKEAISQGIFPGAVAKRKNSVGVETKYGWILLIEWAEPNDDFKLIKGREYGTVSSFEVSDLKGIGKVVLNEPESSEIDYTGYY